MFVNPLRAQGAGGLPDADLQDAASFAPDLPVTPLRETPELAGLLGLTSLLIKDETSRWGLNAFKITGVGYAMDRWRAAGGQHRGYVTASAGNHGRAVARVARERGVRCRVFLPADTLPARVRAIGAEGSDVEQIDGTYEDAVARAAGEAERTGAILVSDTTPPGDPAIPALILRGYTKIFSEAASAWHEPPDLVVVQGGVGGLVGAAAAWMRTRLPDATLMAAEPEGAACLLESARAGRPVTLASTAPTSMVCLRCATPNAAAWPFIASGADGFVTVSDEEAAGAVRALADAGIASGASGACGLAGLMAVAPAFAGRRALVIVTEGP